MARPSAFAGVARAPFLLLPVTLVAVGAAAARVEGAFSWVHTLLALVGLTAGHMAVNIFNEVSDLRTGIDLHTERTPFSGGSGTLPTGAMSATQALLFGVACSVVALAVGAFFVVRVGWVVAPVIIMGAFTIVAYTDVLARIGVGEAAAGIGLGTLPVVGAALVQDGTLGPVPWAASVPAFFMTFNLLLLNEFPDEAADRAGGRRNLVLLLGRRVAAWVWVVAVLAVPVWLVVTVAVGMLPALVLAAALPTLVLTPAARWMRRGPETPVPLPALAANVIWNLATNTVLALALVVAGA